MVKEMNEQEERKLKGALHLLLNMITNGHSMVDIQMVASKVAAQIHWPYLDDKGDEEE
jgi:hypothetical protein|tara:strand:+ start:3109 stop:3282 length:174 start_codon:yes stop_codon:yes gene_type:complete